jgi:hypothetical protein
MRGHAGLGKGVSRFGRKMESVVDSVVDGVDQWVEASIDRQPPPPPSSSSSSSSQQQQQQQQQQLVVHGPVDYSQYRHPTPSHLNAHFSPTTISAGACPTPARPLCGALSLHDLHLSCLPAPELPSSPRCTPPGGGGAAAIMHRPSSPSLLSAHGGYAGDMPRVTPRVLSTP